MTAGERLRQLAGRAGAAGALLLLIGAGTTAGAALVDSSCLSSGTTAEHLLDARVCKEQPIAPVEYHGSGGRDDLVQVVRSQLDLLELRKQSKPVPPATYDGTARAEPAQEVVASPFQGTPASTLADFIDASRPSAKAALPDQATPEAVQPASDDAEAARRRRLDDEEALILMLANLL